jgi:hypothetical protein
MTRAMLSLKRQKVIFLPAIFLWIAPKQENGWQKIPKNFVAV